MIRNFGKICQGVEVPATMAVLKADAYGLGAFAIAEALKTAGVHSFGVADLSEAQALKELDIPIFILGDIFADELELALELGSIVPLSRLEIAQKLSDLAVEKGVRHPVHFNLDTGMGRLGLLPSQAEEFIKSCAELPGLEIVGIYSHFPHAFGDEEFSLIQVQKLLCLIESLEKQGISFKYRHIANSDGIHNISASYQEPFNMVRTGLNLYGCFDVEGSRRIELENVVTLRARLIAVRELPAGSSIGYGRCYKLAKATRVGTIAMGYADGFPRELEKGGYVMVDGIRCSVIGRVSMDYVTIDLSDCPQAQAGTDVICLGDDIKVQQWADWCGTIPYDIICSIGKRVQRHYL